MAIFKDMFYRSLYNFHNLTFENEYVITIDQRLELNILHVIWIYVLNSRPIRIFPFIPKKELT
jgi:hypothetical protein